MILGMSKNSMLFSDVISLTPTVKEWLTNSRHSRILHVFDRVCNLINERGEILSVVSPEIRNGPFNMVIEKEVCFSRHLSIESPISIFPNKLIIAHLTINTTNAKLWNPRPDWERLHTRRYEIFDRLTSLSLLNYQPSIPESIFSTLSRALANADISTARTATSQLAGLGQGLTPSGDDFIMGAILAAWIIHPVNIAKDFADDLAGTAASLTTSLSAAWLKSAGKGEAGSLWHDFFDGLSSENEMSIQGALEKLHTVGHTSGDDALAGFASTIISYAERETNQCPS
jgi:hypothetical protein